MNASIRRPTSLPLILAAVIVPLAAGLALGLSGWGSEAIVRQVVGAVTLASGVILITVRNVFVRPADGAVVVPRSAHQAMRTRMRVAGAGSVLLGAAQFVSDTRLRTVVALLAAAVGFAAIVRFRRLHQRTD